MLTTPISLPRPPVGRVNNRSSQLKTELAGMRVTQEKLSASRRQLRAALDDTKQSGAILNKAGKTTHAQVTRQRQLIDDLVCGPLFL